MPKVMTLENLTIQCAAPNIVDDADVRQYGCLLGLTELVNALFGDMTPGHTADFHFNSAATKSPNDQVQP